MFFQEPTPDTSGYMIAGYAVAFIVMGLYVASLYLRSRNLKQDMSMLEELDQPVVKAETNPASQPKKSAKTVTKKDGKK